MAAEASSRLWGLEADATARRLADGRLATVLLSPAATSFDQFVDYAARGRAFKDAVRALAAGRPA